MLFKWRELNVPRKAWVRLAFGAKSPEYYVTLLLFPIGRLQLMIFGMAKQSALK